MDENKKLRQIVDKFAGKKVLVIGDVMIDKYIIGNVSRISPEAPVQVVNVTKENYVPGGAANVASNAAALGCKAVIIGLVGNDIAAEMLKNELNKRKIEPRFTVSKSKPTIQKIRVIAQNQQLIRVDYEEGSALGGETENKVMESIAGSIGKADVVIVSDYAKGIITGKMMKEIIKECNENKIPLLVDPKPQNKNLYKGATLITPNHKEASEMCGCEDLDDCSLIKAGTKLSKELDSDVLITRGEKGMSLFECKHKKSCEITHVPTIAKEVFDVTGAGDTVIGTLAAAIASGASLKEAMILANHAAGIVVAKVGTATCTAEELKKDLE